MHSEPPQPSLSDLENAMRQEFFERVLSPLPSEHLSEDGRDLVPDTSFLAQLEELMRREFFSRYVYETIKTKDTIRLLQLKPGRRNDPIQGRLIHVSFNFMPEYEALSYC